MLESKVTGVKIVALTTTLPVKEIESDTTQLYYVCDELQTTSDLGYDAAKRVLSDLSIEKEDIGMLLFGSKTPDYRSPNTAAILQGRLGLSIDCICFDTNVGANGFIKMTQVAAALLAKSNSNYALVIIGDTPSKLQNNTADKVFELSDAATAILLQKGTINDIIDFSNYSSGENYKASLLKEGGFRDFDENVPYDGTKSENYILKSESSARNNFFDNIRNLVGDEKQLINSFLIENLKLNDPYKTVRTINADASELPLLLENLFKETNIFENEIVFVSAGEGMALMKMKINNTPIVLPKRHTSEFFEDYKVSHEM